MSYLRDYVYPRYLLVPFPRFESHRIFGSDEPVADVLLYRDALVLTVEAVVDLVYGGSELLSNFLSGLPVDVSSFPVGYISSLPPTIFPFVD